MVLPSRLWNRKDMTYIFLASAIILNMIVEYRGSSSGFGRQHISSMDPDDELIPI